MRKPIVSAVLIGLGLAGMFAVGAGVRTLTRQSTATSVGGATASFDSNGRESNGREDYAPVAPLATSAPFAPSASAPSPAFEMKVAGERAPLGSVGTIGHGAGAMGSSGGVGLGNGFGRMGGAVAPKAIMRPGVGASAPFARAPSRGFLQGPSIAAGEWDDNANYREFQRYLADEEALPIHRVDVSDRRFLVVRDVAGKPVPRCRVTVTDAEQHHTTLTTMASGRAILFPHAEGLSGTDMDATASCPGAAASVHRAFNISDQDGLVDLRITSARELPTVRPVDVAFILDTTGSMAEEIDAVRSTISKVASRLGQQSFRVRLGLVEYKDRGDVFVTKVHPFSASTDRFLADIAHVTAGGGGDLPESVNEGLRVGLTGLEWGQDSVARFAFLIGDAPPHLDYPNDADYAFEMKRAAHEGVQVFTVAASGMDALGQAVFRQVAEYTGGTNLFVLRGGAGPQSTGAGDPKSSCGGTQTNYSSGNLDALIVGKVTRELHGLDGDPMRIAGLYRDEDAKPCGERVAYND